MYVSGSLSVNNATNEAVYQCEIPEGRAGVKATIKIMANIVVEYSDNQAVRQQAAELVGSLAPKDFSGEIRACFYYVRDSIRYLMDGTNSERLHTPDALMEIGQGDCDDKAILLASLLESIGFQCRFKAVGFEEGILSHVYVEVKLGTGWIALDATEPVEPGWEPPNIVTSYVYHI